MTTSAPDASASATDHAPAPDIRLAGLTKRFGSFVAVDGIDLEVGRGEFFTMLGPSGSGKTTTLRLIAGFELPDAGTIELGGEDVALRPPYGRDVNTVFQDYALFPHMTVAENVAYGLKIKGIDRAERRKRAGEALEMVRLEGASDRKPAQLSGGQRQRVALARAIVGRPRVLLLDEPLGALDLKLREQMQTELKAIQGEVGLTFVYVTHDQDEALSMSDRIAVFNEGRIEQVGTPPEVYERPSTDFVAGFVGTSNLLVRGGVQFTVRPEKLQLVVGDAASPDGLVVEGGVVTDTSYVGQATRVTVALNAGGSVVVTEQNRETTADDAAAELRGKPVRVAWRQDQVYEIPAGTGSASAPTLPEDTTP